MSKKLDIFVIQRVQQSVATSLIRGEKRTGRQAR